jgi:H+/Cl- antiporter ClcA
MYLCVFYIYIGRSRYLKAFVCSVSGAFCFRLLGGTGAGPWSQYNGGALFSSVDEDGDIRVFQHERHELIAFSVLGVIAGLLGSGFVWLHRFMLLHKRDRWSGSTYSHAVCIAVITALMTFPDVMGDFMYMGDKALIEDMLSTRGLHETQHVNGQHWASQVRRGLQTYGSIFAAIFPY